MPFRRRPVLLLPGDERRGVRVLSALSGPVFFGLLALAFAAGFCIGKGVF